MSKKVIVIGSGFSGLSAASNLALQGFEVTILEKNPSPGGRASKFEKDGFVFDMGPSWYWMPDVFETYFETFGRKPADFYDLVRLDPSYKVVFGKDDEIEIPANLDELNELFEKLEPGSSPKFRRFLSEAAYKYKVGISDLVYRPGRSISEFIDFRLLKSVFKLHLFSSVRKHVYRLFKNDRIRKILEFPVYFLGALPSDTPALYSL